MKTPVVTFGIPLAPKSKWPQWDEAMVNLNRTLKSLENQTSDRYRIVLVKTYDDYLDDGGFQYKYKNLAIYSSEYTGEFSSDKDEKTMVAMRAHTLYDAKYFFRLDWDDLIHKRFVQFLVDNPNENGWVIQYGYFFRPDLLSVIPIMNYWTQCGSAFAINYDYDECLKGPVHSFHHQQIPKNRASLGKPLKPMPFYMGMYTIHPHNISKEKHQRILKGAPWQDISTNQKEEFGLT